MAKKTIFSKRTLLAAATSLLVIALGSPANAWGDAPTTNEPTQAEVAAFIASNPWRPNASIVYDDKPLANGQNAGIVAQTTQQEALNCVNTMRYAAGLPVLTLDKTKSASAQAAAYVNALNDSLSHTPPKPESCTEAIYQLGSQSAALCNLSLGYTNHIDSIKSLMSDSSGESNLAKVGHRRWMLSPTLQTTGFGFTTLYSAHYSRTMVWSAMRVVESSSALYPKTDKVIKWPAANTPLGLFQASDPWLIELGTTYKSVDPTKVSVVIEDLTHHKSLTIPPRLGGSFTSTESYISTAATKEECIGGLGNSLIFRPKPESFIIDNGSQFRITVKGLQHSNGSDAPDFTYRVNFFSAGLTKIATLSGASFTYDGEFHSIYPKGDGYRLVSGTVIASNPGTYTAVFEPASGYCWSDGSVARRTISWEIKAAPTQSENPIWAEGSNVIPSKTPIAQAAVAVKPKTYTGKAQKCGAPVVKVGGKTLRNGTDFAYTCKAGKAVGSYVVTIKGKGAYTGTRTAKFQIVPKGVAAKRPAAAKRGFTAKWARPSSKHLKQTTGYQVQWSTDKKFKKGVKSKLVKGAKKTSLKVSKLKAKKTYYMKVRAYKQVGKAKYYSAWSKTQKVKTRK